MNGQYFILICDNKEEAIEKAMEALKEYKENPGAYSESRGGANYRGGSGGGGGNRENYRNNMSQREREIYEMGLRDSMTPREREIYEMARRDAYGRNGAENMRENDGGRIPMQPSIPPRGN